MEIKITTDISWKHDGEEIYLGNGSITLSESSIVVDVIVTPEVCELIRNTHPACIDIHQDFTDNIRYRRCYIEDTSIRIDKTDAYVTCFSCSSNNSMSWKLSCLKIEYNTIAHRNYSLVSVPYCFLLLVLRQSYSTIYPRNIDVIFCGKIYTLSDANDPNYTILKAPANSDVEGLLLMISLYTKTLAEMVISFSSNSDNQIIKCTPALHKQDNVDPRNYELKFIKFGEQRTLCNFLEHCRWADKDDDEKSLLRQAIYTYARTKYMDYNLQFLSTYSILERFTGKKKGDNPYEAMADGLKRYNIEIQKIGNRNDPEICPLHLKLKRSSKDVNVINFCDLRDYIMHFMSNPKIDRYLAKSNLVSHMRMAVLIILLIELGFKNISFLLQWGHQSVLIDSN